MATTPNLIVMLTHNDFTVANAADIFELCKHSDASFWGFKEQNLPLEQMIQLNSRIKECGKTTILEVVAYTEEEGLIGAETALKCGCDILMGTIYSDTINNFCIKNSLKYMPFVGNITGRPSILSGAIEDILTEAKKYISKGVYGIDLLGYRYNGNAAALNEVLTKNINAPICIAGSINNYQKIDEIKRLKPWGFTIGSAFFNNKFGYSFCEQINNVCNYLKQ